MIRDALAAPLLALLLVLPACSGDEGSDAGDASLTLDAAAADASFLADTGAAEADAGTSADGGEAEADAAVDAGPPDGGAAEDGGEPAADAGASTCRYDLGEMHIVLCGGAPTYLSELVDFADRSCPPRYVLGGTTYGSLSDALTGEGCSDQCLYRAAMSVSFIDHCGRRNGYIVFRAPDPGACPDVYEFFNGLFPSVEAWERDTPCGP